MAPTRARLSVFIVCCNEEHQIERCLQSVSWADEIVVIDSGSTDKTLEICRKFTNNIHTRPWPGFVEQKRFGLQQCTGDWIFNIDADEVVTPELQSEIEAVLASDGDHQRVSGYRINRVVFFLGRWWRRGGWYPEYRLRLCRRSVTTWGGADPHEKAIVDGVVETLKGELSHYTYDDLEHQIRSLNSHSTAAAQSLFEKGRTTNLFEILTRPVGRFFKFYFLRLGLLEGMAGLLVAFAEAHYVLLKYAKLWELNRNGPKTGAGH